MKNSFMHFLKQVTGNWQEQLISGIGGFVGIAVLFFSDLFISHGNQILVTASMGASAVLLFAVPHGSLSQPWPLVGGHLVSAIIGVSCAQFMEPQAIAAAVAVGLSISMMYFLRCLHPPGGATALIAVIGGPNIQSLGYGFVLYPILLDASLLLIVAILFNWFFTYRRYPAFLSKQKSTDQNLDHQHLAYALNKMNTFVDVSEEDLMQIFQFATQRAKQSLPPDSIELGAYYSNGEYGQDWSVRQVVDESGVQGENDQLIYKVVAGKDRRKSGMMSRQAFAQWAKYPMVRDDENWKRRSY